MQNRNWYRQLIPLIEKVIELLRVLCIAVILLVAYIVVRIKGI
jgi:hypothetical protein